jgi:SpoVK/Ycf46/Vps4 family AAA+-type ATPase
MYPAGFATGVLHREAVSGILLYGSPGTGKMMLCCAISKECNVRMLLAIPSDIEDMWIGKTEIDYCHILVGTQDCTLRHLH